jgi:hypothetical protein
MTRVRVVQLTDSHLEDCRGVAREDNLLLTTRRRRPDGGRRPDTERGATDDATHGFRKWCRGEDISRRKVSGSWSRSSRSWYDARGWRLSGCGSGL